LAALFHETLAIAASHSPLNARNRSLEFSLTIRCPSRLLGDDHQSFKKRIKAVPAILSRRVDGKEEVIDLSKQWGKDLIDGQLLRNRIMHSAFGEPLSRVTKQELIQSAKAVFAYFEELAVKFPATFEHMNVLLRAKPNL
jgi:hypothetical protein